MHNLEFGIRHKYDDSVPGITVPVHLEYQGSRVQFDAKIDTGAELCLFDRGYGEALGIEIESGYRKELRTINSTLVAYGHEVTLSILDLNFDLMAFFYEAPEIHRNVLGRQGWLVKVRLGVVDYEQLVYIGSY
jgi:hypothetical protein